MECNRVRLAQGIDSSAVGYSKVDIDFQEYKEYNRKSISNKSTVMNMAHHQELGSICLS